MAWLAGHGRRCGGWRPLARRHAQVTLQGNHGARRSPIRWASGPPVPLRAQDIMLPRVALAQPRSARALGGRLFKRPKTTRRANVKRAKDGCAAEPLALAVRPQAARLRYQGDRRGELGLDLAHRDAIAKDLENTWRPDMLKELPLCGSRGRSKSRRAQLRVRDNNDFGGFGTRSPLHRPWRLLAAQKAPSMLSRRRCHAHTSRTQTPTHTERMNTCPVKRQPTSPPTLPTPSPIRALLPTRRHTAHPIALTTCAWGNGKVAVPTPRHRPRCAHMCSRATHHPLHHRSSGGPFAQRHKPSKRGSPPPPTQVGPPDSRHENECPTDAIKKNTQAWPSRPRILRGMFVCVCVSRVGRRTCCVAREHCGCSPLALLYKRTGPTPIACQRVGCRSGEAMAQPPLRRRSTYMP